MQTYPIDKIIERFDLAPHPEGGYFKRIYTHQTQIAQQSLSGYSGNRNIASAILYLLPAGTFSALHTLKQDETWHFHSGCPLRITEISSSSTLKQTYLGNDYNTNQQPVHTVFGDTWFFAEPTQTEGYSFVSCSVAPAFDFEDFSLITKNKLKQTYPDLYHQCKTFCI